MEISVIIPTYKPSEYIWKCLDSVRAQTIDKKLFEVVIVLNGCKVPYESQIRHYIESFLNKFNINFIQTEISGVSNARNIGLANAQGKYVCFIDDDDLISPNYIEEMLLRVNENTIIVSHVLAFNNDNIKNLQSDYLGFSAEFISNDLFKSRRFFSNVCCKLIPIDAIKNKRFYSDLKNGEDALFMFSISDDIHTVISTSPSTIYYRRLRENSASRKKRALSYEIKNRLKLQARYTKYYLSNPFKYDFLLYLSRMVAVWKTFKLNGSV